VKTYTIRFVQQKPGGTKRVPVVTNGIQVGYGHILDYMVVSLGSPAGKLWEVPLMVGNPPLVTPNGRGEAVKDCHPVPNRCRQGSFLLAKSEHESQRVLVRVITEAGEQSGPSGAVMLQKGNAVRVGYGDTINKTNAKSVDTLLDVYLGAAFVVTAGGTGSALHQRYLVEYNGEIKISPLAESPAVVAVNPRPVTVAPTPAPAVAKAESVDNRGNGDSEDELARELEELARSASGRRAGTKTMRPGQLVAA